MAFVKPGERVVIETEDAFNGNLKTPEDVVKLTHSKALPPNPVTGPIYIEGSQSGDILVANIDNIKLDDIGSTCFARTSFNPINFWFDNDFARIFEIRDQKVKLSKTLEVMAEPFVGCIATAPAYGAPASVNKFQSGGNMDCCQAKPGSKVFLPVNVEGAYFYLGDVHALQGDGEFCDTAVETRAEVELHFDIIPSAGRLKLKWPRIETAELLTTVAAGMSLDDCFRTAVLEMLTWLEVEYNLPRKDVFLELTQVANLRPCNRTTGRCELPKKFLKI